MTPILQKTATRLYKSAAIWTLVFAAVRSLGNLVVLPLMLHKLPQEDLGFWYVFLSLAGLAALVDMGFFPTMSRVTAYLWAGAEKIEKLGTPTVQEVVGSTVCPNYRLLGDLVKTMQLYYLGLGILITFVLAIFGTAWIAREARYLGDARAIVSAWVLFLPGIFVNITSGMWHPLLSGINEVRLNQQILILGLVANYVITFIGLLLGIGLLAPVAGYLAMGSLSRVVAQAKFNQLTQAKTYKKSARWSRDLLSTLWPTAWRSGLVTLGIYATLNASTLISTAFLGIKATASFGLSLQLALAAITVATGFFSVKIPLIAQLHARGRSSEISSIVFPRLRWFWVVYLSLSLATVLFGQPLLENVLHSKTPLLSAPLLTALFIVIGLEGHHAIFREITLTSHRNPFARPVVISGILIVLLSLVLVQLAGMWGLILAPGIIQICFNNWWTVLVGLRSIGKSVSDYLSGLFGCNNTRRSTAT